MWLVPRCIAGASSTKLSARKSSGPCTVSGSSTRRPLLRFSLEHDVSILEEHGEVHGAIRTTPSRSCWPKRRTRFGRGISRSPVPTSTILKSSPRKCRARPTPHAESCRKQDIEPDQLTLHADRGSSMRSKPVGLLLADLVTKTHSRPSERQSLLRQFKTMKLSSVSEPLWFRRDGRLFCCGFFDYYNFHQSGIGLMTPAEFTMVEPNSSPPLRSFSKLNRLTNASFNRPASAGLDQPAAGKNDPPRCRTSPSRGGVHTWGTPFCFTQQDLDRC